MTRYKKTGPTISYAELQKLRNGDWHERTYNSPAVAARQAAAARNATAAKLPASGGRYVSPVESVAKQAINGSGRVIDQVGGVTLNPRQMEKLRKAQAAIDKTYGAAASAARGAAKFRPVAGAILPGIRAIGWIMDIIDLTRTPLGDVSQIPGNVVPIDGAWVLTQNCGKPSNGLQWGQLDTNAPTPNWGFCLNGQNAMIKPLGSPVPAYQRTLALVQRNASFPNSWVDFHKVWTHPAWHTGTAGLRQINTYIDPLTAPLNPNLVRALPGDLNIEALMHAPVINPLLSIFPSVAEAIASGTTAKTLASTVRIPAGPPFNGGTIVGSPGARNPPAKGERTRKQKGPLGRVLAVLDAISEGSEVVDAFYEALPKKTQKDWDCNRKAAFIDNAGQYGIDNADCKLAALWHNWHKVDMNKAVQNVVANHIQDKVIGGIQQMIPPNSGRAVDSGMKGVNKALDELFKAVGLQD